MRVRHNLPGASLGTNAGCFCLSDMAMLILIRFTGRYNTMVVFLYRPSPQVPKPSVRAANMCYDACAFNIKMLKIQGDAALLEMTWISLQALFMAVNTLLWTISYTEIRALHAKAEVDEHLQTALKVIRQCVERWPGSLAAADLYVKLGEACLRSYDYMPCHPASSNSATSPASFGDAATPSSEHYSEHSSATTASHRSAQKPSERQASFEPPPIFGAVFDQSPTQVPQQDHQHVSALPLPTFRSGLMLHHHCWMLTI